MIRQIDYRGWILTDQRGLMQLFQQRGLENSFVGRQQSESVTSTLGYDRRIYENEYVHITVDCCNCCDSESHVRYQKCMIQIYISVDMDVYR